MANNTARMTAEIAWVTNTAASATPAPSRPSWSRVGDQAEHGPKRQAGEDGAELVGDEPDAEGALQADPAEGAGHTQHQDRRQPGCRRPSPKETAR